MKRSSVLLAGLTSVLAGLLLLLSVLAWPAAAAARSSLLAETDMGGATPLGAASPGAQPLQLHVNYAHDWAYVHTDPLATVVITVTDSDGIRATVTGEADDNGDFNSWAWPWQPEPINIVPGDTVLAESLGVVTAIDPIGEIMGELDVDADAIEGSIAAPWFAPGSLMVHCEIWQEGGPVIDVPGVPAAGGSYACDFSGMWDIQPGQDVAVRYVEPDGDHVINVFQEVLPQVSANYAHDWVEGMYEPGHTIWITVTASDGVTVKATAVMETLEVPWWGGQTGFSTNLDDPWLPAHPDIVAGDWVYVHADDGYDNALHLGEIGGDLDLDNDSISGPITAPWLLETLEVECHAWGAPGGAPNKQSTAEPDGSTNYFCQWDPVSEWDVLPGQDVGVSYREPDGDQVFNAFRAPAADMRVEKWVEGSDQVAPDGLAVFTLYYRNDGDDAAETVWLTDTMPANTTYVTDSSGVTPVIDGNQVIWELGPVAAQTEGRFQVVLLNMNAAGETLLNQADIAAPYDFNDGNNHAEAQVFVVAETPDLYIGKYINPGNPAPGQTFTYQLWYGNNGPVSSEMATIVDTLPPDTTIVSWYSANGYGLWQENSTADHFILEAPSVPGYWGDQIILRLALDETVPPGTQLINTVEMLTALDANPDDNLYVHDNGYVGDPYWNGALSQEFGWGQLVAGGEMGFNLHVRNDGNMPALATLVDTLPAHASYVDAWAWIGPDYVPFPPDNIHNGILTWNLGTLEPAESLHIDLRLAIGANAAVGAALTNCADLSIDGPDGFPYDNSACVTDYVQPAGPNLRLTKSYWWDWEGQMVFNIRLENLGTTRLDDVWVTDLYPDDVSWNGDWWVEYGPWITVTHNAAQQQLLFWVERLHPGEGARFNYRLDVDSDLIGVPGLSFTNIAEAPVTGDVNPDDNAAAVTATTGPDLYVEKWLSGGEPRPGELITFTIRFGNQSQWPWDSGPQTFLTDALPAEMTFITATAPWNANETWTPTILPGNVLEWEWGTMWGGAWWQFDVVVQIADDAPWDAVLVNQVEVASPDPDDVEVNYDNNTATAAVTVTVYHLWLPVMAR